MVVIARGWLLLAGVEAGWVRGRGNGSGGAETSGGGQVCFFWAQNWDFDPDLGVEKKVQILTIPLCWGPPECLPRHFLKIRYF